MEPLLRRDLANAMRARDAIATAALRSALAAIQNAQAVPPGQAPAPSPHGHPSVAGSTQGLGAAEVPRRHLEAADVEAVVRREVLERLAAAREYARLGQDEPAGRLRAEAAVLTRYLTDGPA